MPNFCTNCGSPINPSANFCGNCGARIIDTQAIDPVEAGAKFEGYDPDGNENGPDPVGSTTSEKNKNNTMLCFQCNEEIPADSNHCPYCSTSLYIDCPKCGFRYEARYPACSKCGTNREDYLKCEQERKKAEEQQRREKETKKRQEEERKRLLEEEKEKEDRKKKEALIAAQKNWLINYINNNYENLDSNCKKIHDYNNKVKEYNDNIPQKERNIRTTCIIILIVAFFCLISSIRLEGTIEYPGWLIFLIFSVSVMFVMAMVLIFIEDFFNTKPFKSFQTVLHQTIKDQYKNASGQEFLLSESDCYNSFMNRKILYLGASQKER